MKYTINVTQADIDDGRARNCRKCPVALACDRVIPKFQLVGYDSLWWTNDEGMTVGSNHTYEVLKFIRLFDDQGVAEPFSFDVEIP